MKSMGVDLEPHITCGDRGTGLQRAFGSMFPNSIRTNGAACLHTCLMLGVGGGAITSWGCCDADYAHIHLEASKKIIQLPPDVKQVTARCARRPGALAAGTHSLPSLLPQGINDGVTAIHTSRSPPAGKVLAHIYLGEWRAKTESAKAEDGMWKKHANTVVAFCDWFERSCVEQWFSWLICSPGGTSPALRTEDNAWEVYAVLPGVLPSTQWIETDNKITKANRIVKERASLEHLAMHGLPKSCESWSAWRSGDQHTLPPPASP